jgi:hypothetical protein
MLLAGTMFAAAQQSGQPSNNNDRTGAPTDAGTTSADPVRPGGTQGQGGGSNMGSGGSMGSGSGTMQNNSPLQPGGTSPSAPPQGGPGESAQPRPR